MHPGADPRACLLRARARAEAKLRRHDVGELHWDPARPDGGIDALGFYRDFVHASTPCVIRGMAKEWPAMKRWASAAGLLSRIGPKAELTVAFTPNGRADAVTRVPAERVTNLAEASVEQRAGCDCDRADEFPAVEAFVSPLQRKIAAGDFFRLLLSQQRRCGDPFSGLAALEPPPDAFDRHPSTAGVVYAQCQDGCLATEYHALGQDCGANVANFGERLFGSAPDAANVWIGSTHSVTSVHQDWYENLYAVVAGTKVFALIPPWEATHLRKQEYVSAEYVERASSDGAAHGASWGVHVAWEAKSKTRWIRADPALAPDDPANRDDRDDLAGATCLTVAVGPGDVLYLPATWFHHVAQANDREGKVVAVNYWFDMRFGAVAAVQQVFDDLDASMRAGWIAPSHTSDALSDAA